MNKSLKIMFFVVLGILLFSFKGMAEPTSSNPMNVTPSNYNSLTYSKFNVTWLNGTSTTSISQVKIIANFSGSDQNYSMNLISGDEYNGTYNFQEVLGAGTYQWKSCAIDNETNENCAGYYYFTINKVTPLVRLFLNDSEGDKTVDIGWVANLTAISDTGTNLTLNTNLSGWIDQNSITSIYNLTKFNTEGVYNITAFANENQNFTYNATTWFLKVEEIKPQILNTTVIPVNNSQYSPNKIYQFNITIQEGSLTDLTFNIFNTTPTGGNPVNITLNLTNGLLNYTGINDNVKIYSANISDLPAGNYSYIWNATDSFGQSNTTSYNYTVSINIPTVTLTNPAGTWTITTNSIRVTCTSGSPLNLTLRYDSIDAATGSSSIYADLSSMINGNHNVDCTVQGNGNYSSATSGNQVLTVNVQSTSGDNQGGNQQTSTGSFTITGLPSTLSVNAGESKATSFDLKDTLGYNLLKTNISLTGIDSSWYSFSSASISSLMRNVPEKITLTFNIPSNAEAKDYTIKISAKGGIPGSTSTKTAEATMKLTVVSTQPTQNNTETVNVNQPTNESTNQTNQTTNQTAGPTGLSIRPEDIPNIVLIGGFISAAFVFIYREKVTFALTRGKQIKPKAETTKKETSENIPEPKFKIPKPDIKMPKILSYKLNINLVKNVKDKEDKNK